MNWKKKYYLDIGIAVLIAVLPFCLYLYVGLNKTDTTFYFLGKEYTPAAVSVSVGLYYLLSKLVPTLILSLWFITSFKYRFYSFFVLVPTYYFLHKTISFFEYFIGNDIPESFLKSGCIFLIYLVPLFYLRSKVKQVYERSPASQESYLNSVYHINKKRNNLKKHQNVIKSLSKIIENEKVYLYNIFHLRSSLSSDDINHYDVSNKKKSTYIFFWFYLLLIPFIYNIYQIIPKSYEINFFYWEKANNGFLGAAELIYYLTNKLIPISILIIWYITCDYWWKLALFIPISIYSYQIHDAIFVVSSSVDEYEYIKAFPLVFCFIVFTILLSKMYKYDLKSYSIRKQLDQEIDRLINKFAKRNS